MLVSKLDPSQHKCLGKVSLQPELLGPVHLVVLTAPTWDNTCMHTIAVMLKLEHVDQEAVIKMLPLTSFLVALCLPGASGGW